MNFDLKTPCYSVPFVVILLICLFLVLPQAAYSDPEESIDGPQEAVVYFPDGFPYPDAGALEDLEKILASPDFGSYKEGWGIRFKEREEEIPEMPDLDFVRWLEKIRELFGYILRGFAILVTVGFVCFAFYWLWKYRRKKAFRFRDRGRNYVNPLFSPESPESLFARAEEFFFRGNQREAWAACLAGCIGACEKYHSLSFPADATEYGCLDMVRRTLPAEAGGFGDLVKSWILFAYGGRAPGEGAFEEALAYGRALLVRPRSSDEP